VEESFNMQAIHDLLELGVSFSWWKSKSYEDDMLKSFDHLEFSGVVPRTFIGALLISFASFPFHMLFKCILHLPKHYSQLMVRGVLGFLLWLSYLQFRNGIAHRFGARAGSLAMFLTALQFHTPFYMTRTLPNTFALAACLWAFGSWLRGQPVRALCFLGAAAVVFRCDLLVLLAPLALQLLLAKEVPFWATLGAGVAACLAALAVAVTVDSFFWRTPWLWAEGVVLLFNTGVDIIYIYIIILFILFFLIMFLQL